MGRPKKESLAELCRSLNIEIAHRMDGTCEIVTPKKLSVKDRHRIESYLADIPRSSIIYTVKIKDSTLSAFTYILIRNKIPFHCLEKNGIISIVSDIEFDPSIKDEITKILKSDGYPSGWNLILGKEEKYKILFDALEAMKERDPSKEYISEDDLTNLKITLETVSTIDDFIKSMG